MKNTYIDGLSFPDNHPFKKDSERLISLFRTDAYISDGVVRWKSNNQVPPKDVLQLWQYVGLIFDFVKSVEAQKADMQCFIEDYRKNAKPPTEEELFEMRAAFGEGEAVVNILTGRRIKL